MTLVYPILKRGIRCVKKTEKKNICFLFFSSQPGPFDKPTVCSPNTSLDWENVFHRKVFLYKQELMFTRTISFLYLISETSTVFRKSKLFPLVRIVFCRNLFHVVVVTQHYTSVLLWLLLIVNKRLGYVFPDRTIDDVSCRASCLMSFSYCIPTSLKRGPPQM